MQVLLQLASHENEVLSKERLIQTVWSDTFVGDEVLTRCISEIRRVLEDDAKAPRFVQTIPKVGYRLMVPVEKLDHPSGQIHPRNHAPGSDVNLPPAQPAVLPSAPSANTLQSLSRPTRWVLGLLIALGIVGAAIWATRFHRNPSTVQDFRTLPLTSYSGSQTEPAFSPDGNKVAFVWNGESGQHVNIYVKVIGTENPVRLTSGPGDDYSPAWSPDGRFIAFLRAGDSPADQGIYMIPSVGGPARKLIARSGVTDVGRMSLTWSPDGKQIVFNDGKSTHTPSSLFSLNVDTLQMTPLTTPDRSWDGDYTPVFSPDGQSIGFIRDVEASVRDVYILPASGGEPKRLTSDNRQVSSIAWSSDGLSIIFSSDRGGKFALWRVPAVGGAIERLPVGTEDAYFPAIAPRGDRLAFTQTSAQWSVVRVQLATSGKPTTTLLLSSTEQDSAPRFSPNGSRIAFQSWRSGTQEIWVCDSNGGGPVRLTSFNGPLTGSPSWSPDGNQIAFDSRPEGRSHIYVVSVNGGMPQRVTSGDHNDILPSWSHDMKSIYFSSNRGGSWNIWKAALAGGEAVQITKNGGFVGVESYDAAWLYFSKADLSGLWRIPVAGGAEEQILPQPKSGFWGYFSVAKDGIYYLDSDSTPPSINFLDTATARSHRLHALDHMPPVYNGLTVAADGRTLVYTDATPVGSHITLVENFR